MELVELGEPADEQTRQQLQSFVKHLHELDQLGEHGEAALHRAVRAGAPGVVMARDGGG